MRNPLSGVPVALLLGCLAGSLASRATANDAPSELAGQLGLHCVQTASSHGCTLGNLETGDFYDVELTAGCGAHGFFAGLIAASASLLDTLPVTGSDAHESAFVTDGQRLCVQAIARAGQQPAYYYVTALPSTAPRSGHDCALRADGQPTGDCAHGWLDAEAVEAFSNDP